jgi:hypothetical protein
MAEMRAQELRRDAELYRRARLARSEQRKPVSPRKLFLAVLSRLAML